MAMKRIHRQHRRCLEAHQSLSDDCSISVRLASPSAFASDLVTSPVPRDTKQLSDALARRRAVTIRKGRQRHGELPHIGVTAARATFRDTASRRLERPRNSGAQLPKRSWRIGQHRSRASDRDADAERNAPRRWLHTLEEKFEDQDEPASLGCPRSITRGTCWH